MQAEFSQNAGYAIHSVNITINRNGTKYNAGGMVISGEFKNGNLESYIGFSANNFAFFNPANGKLEPFMTVKNGQVFIRDGFIENGSITNAKIGNYIQSRDYTAGRAGWKIDKSGFAEFGNIKARGEINATSGSLRNVTIEEDCKIKGTLSVNNIVGDIVKVYTMYEGSLTIPPSPFDRVVVIPALQISAKSSKQAWVALNGNTICRARTYATSMGGYSNGYISVSGYVPSVITGYGVLPKNVPGAIQYYQEGDAFMITILAFKA
ncbi:phage tail tip fiber protein [Xenorhabdus ishibashii]